MNKIIRLWLYPSFQQPKKPLGFQINFVLLRFPSFLEREWGGES